MRLWGSILVVVAVSLSSADAKPKTKATPAAKPANSSPATPPAQPGAPAGKQPTPQQAAELAKLEKELIDHQVKQANFAAVKIAKQLYELQKKATGEDSPEAQRRKQ